MTNTPPRIVGLTTSVSFTLQQALAQQLIDSSIQVADDESYAGMVLHVSGFGEYVQVRHEGTGPDQVGISGNTITYAGAQVAQFAGGVGTDLAITFSTSDPAILTRVIGNLLFFAPAARDSTRLIHYTLYDGSGARFDQDVRLTLGAGTQPSPENDTLYGSAANDHLNGLAGDDLLFGFEGDDVLIGDTGKDVMDGGAGSDVFYVDNPLDIVTDPVAAGVDRVATSVSYVLPGGADIEIFEAIDSTSVAAIDLGGNNYGQTIVGNAGNNLINGGGGDDLLAGLGGDDTLIGSPGADLMYGGVGNDVYFVDATGDRVYETVGEGRDRVAVSISYALEPQASVEILETTALAGTSSIDLRGSSASQMIIGNNGANRFDGGGGNDWMIGAGGDDSFNGTYSASRYEGGAGNDTYFIYDGSDLVVELAGGGVDRVAVLQSYHLAAGSEVEILETLDIQRLDKFSLIGNEFGQLIIGNRADNFLDGKLGSDLLVGAGTDNVFNGGDRFAFTTALGPDNIDRVEDFSHDVDTIVLDDAILKDLSPGSLDPNRFVTGPAATDADDRLIYEQSSGTLMFDADGTGTIPPVTIAIFTGSPVISPSDFLII